MNNETRKLLPLLHSYNLISMIYRRQNTHSNYSTENRRQLLGEILSWWGLWQRWLGWTVWSACLLYWHHQQEESVCCA